MLRGRPGLVERVRHRGNPGGFRSLTPAAKDCPDSPPPAEFRPAIQRSDGRRSYSTLTTGPPIALNVVRNQANCRPICRGPRHSVLRSVLTRNIQAPLQPAATGADPLFKRQCPRQLGRGIAFARKTASVLGISLLVGFLNFSLDAAAAVNRIAILPGPLTNLCRVLVPAA